MLKINGAQPKRPTFLQEIKSCYRGSEHRLIEEIEYARGRFSTIVVTNKKKEGMTFYKLLYVDRIV